MNKQAVAPKSIPITEKAFDFAPETHIYWLSGSSMMIASHGTTLMIDPVLEGFDMPLLVDVPIRCEDVLSLDAILITHSDNDHFSRVTNRKLADVTKQFHAPHYVVSLLKEEGIDGFGHDIHETFAINTLSVTLTPADHAWQNESSKHSKIRTFLPEDYCGFWIDTPEGSIWLVGDSRLMEEQLNMPQPDVILFDFSDNSWHIGLDNAIKLANTYPDSQLILIHWGTVDAPAMDAFNGDPQSLMDRIIHPQRIVVLAPGERYQMKSKK